MRLANRIPAAIVIILALALPAGAQEPIDVLRKPVEEVLVILKDPSYQPADRKEAQREELNRVIRQIFDYVEMSKRALARNWKIFTLEERKAFNTAFSQLLENTYINKIQGEFNDEQVVFLGQETLKKGKVAVKTHVFHQGKQVPVDYRMLQRNGNWRVYDVRVEGISLIRNYRTQFNDILSKESPAQLIERLEKKVLQLKGLAARSPCGAKRSALACVSHRGLHT